MIIVPSIHIPRLALSNGSAILTASTVAHDEYEQWSTVLTYSSGALRRCTRDLADDGVWRNYRSKLNDNTGNFPPDSPTYWEDLGPVNRFRMFTQDPDDPYATQPNIEEPSTTPSGTNLTVTLDPQTFVDAVVLHNVIGESVRVEVVDPAGPTTVYDETRSLLVGGKQKVFDLAFTDLPGAVSNPEITITIAYISGVGAACGLCVIGRQVQLGCTLLGASVGIRDYSTKDVSDDGVVTLAPGRFVRRFEADVLLDTAADVPVIQRQLIDRRATPLSWIGDQGRGELIVYGYYRDFSITIPSAVHAICALEVDGI